MNQARLGLFPLISLANFVVVGDGPQTSGNRGRGFVNDERGFNDSAYNYPFMYAYPYWMMYPVGWGYYPAACASGLAGVGGWGAGVGASCGKSLHFAFAKSQVGEIVVPEGVPRVVSFLSRH